MSFATNSIQLDLIYSALGHKKRRGIIHTLSFRPATVKQLADEHKISLPAIHKHIRSLEEAKLIIRKKSGRTNFVALNKKSLNSAQNWLNQYHSEWGNEQESLDNYIAGLKE